MPRRSRTWSNRWKSRIVERNKGFWILAIYFFLAIYLLPMFPHGGSANELTRWATAASLVEKSSFEISWTEPLIGPNVDTAKVGDRVYSNKPPGTALLAAPIYALTRVFVGAPDESNIRVTWFVMRLALSSIPLLLLGAWLYSRNSDGVSLAVLLFATPVLVYSLLFFSHVLVGIALYMAFRVLYDSERISLGNCLLAGFLCGFAVISEFPAIVPTVILGIGLFFADRRNEMRRRLPILFAIGGLPFAIFLLSYNNALFGSPFSMSYGFESFPEWAEVAGQGVFGVGVPSVSNVFLLLLSPSRGLFFTAPILIYSAIALVASRERRTLRHRVKAAVIILTIVVLCGHGAAHGGWAFGPRYLVLLVPMMLDSFFDGEIDEYSNVWQGFLFGISFLLCAIPILTFPFAPPEFTYPHNQFWTKFLIDEAWFTPNLGNVLGVQGFGSILPALVALAALLYLVPVCARRPRRFVTGMSLGLGLVVIYLFIPGLHDADSAFRRATIAERYFRPASRLEAFERGIAPERIRDMKWNIANTRAYAPNDFPYLPVTPLVPSPVAELRDAIALQNAGKTAEAEAKLIRGREQYPFAACEFGTNLGTLFYVTGRKNEARLELESVQPLVSSGSRPDCMRSQFLLGTLYRELGETALADAVFAKFLNNSANSADPQIRAFRQQLGAN